MIAKRSDFTDTAWEAMEGLLGEYGYTGIGELLALVLRKEARTQDEATAFVLRAVAKEVLRATA